MGSWGKMSVRLMNRDPEQWGWPFAEDIFQQIIMNENHCILSVMFDMFVFFFVCFFRIESNVL